MRYGAPMALLLFVLGVFVPADVSANEFGTYFSGPALNAAAQFPAAVFDHDPQAVLGAGWDWGFVGIFNWLASVEGDYLGPADAGQLRGTVGVGWFVTVALTSSAVFDRDDAFATLGCAAHFGLPIRFNALHWEKLTDWNKADLVSVVFRSDFPLGNQVESHAPWYQLGLRYTFNLDPRINLW